ETQPARRPPATRRPAMATRTPSAAELHRSGRKLLTATRPDLAAASPEARPAEDPTRISQIAGPVRGRTGQWPRSATVRAGQDRRGRNGWPSCHTAPSPRGGHGPRGEVGTSPPRRTAQGPETLGPEDSN